MAKKKHILGIMELFYQANPEEKEFDALIGDFIDVFSLVEGALLYVVMRYAKLPARVGQAILSPLRIDEGITILKRVIEARKLRTKSAKEIIAIVDQLSIINKARNDIVHLGIWNHRMTTNRDYAHAKRLVRNRPITKNILRDMISDLNDIDAFFIWHFAKGRRKKKDKVMYRLREIYPMGKLPAWRYKYPEPKNNRRKRRARPQARGGQPPTSSE